MSLLAKASLPDVEKMKGPATNTKSSPGHIRGEGRISSDLQCPRRIYDSRSKIDVRDNPHHSANDSIWRIFSADFSDGQRQWLHGESAATELFSRRTCPRRSHRDSF